jgi:hypothetical protein
MNSADLPEISGIDPGLWPSVPWQPAHEALSIWPWLSSPAWAGDASTKLAMIETATSGTFVDVRIAKFLVFGQ